MKEKAKSPLYGIGGVTLLTVLLVLVLTMFSVLAFSSSQADYRLSVKSAQAVSAFYEAENKAFAMMKLAEEIWPAGAARPSLSAFSLRLGVEFTQFGVLTEVEKDGFLMSAEIALENTLMLQISVYLGPGDGGTRWDVRQWQVLPPEQDLGDIFFLDLWRP